MGRGEGGGGVEEIYPKLKLIDIMYTRDCLLQWATKSKTPFLVFSLVQDVMALS